MTDLLRLNLPDSRRAELGKIVDMWLAHHAVHAMWRDVEQSCKYFPEIGWLVILELVRQAPSDEILEQIAGTREPLETLISKHGTAFIDRVEAEARSNPIFTKCLRMLDIASNRIRPELWNRLADASGLKLRVRPHSEPTWLRKEEPEIESMLDFEPHHMMEPPQLPPSEMAAAWLTSQETFWAWEAIRDVVERGEADAWFVLSELVRRSSLDGLGAIGAGPLEDWLGDHGEKVIDLVEEVAAQDQRWRIAISSVWQGKMREELWQRVVRTRGDEPERG